MKKILIASLIALMLVLSTCFLLAATSKHPAKKPIAAVCPVMGTKIPDVSKAAGHSVYKGKTYYFCCPGCKPKFDKNPKKYAEKKR